MTRFTNRDLIRDLPTTELFLDRYFSTGAYFDTVAAGNQKRILVSNPSDSDVILLLIDPTVRATGQAKVNKSKNVSIDTEGDAPNTGLVSKSTGEVSTVASAQVGGDNETGVFSGGVSFSPKIVGSGAGGGSASPGSSSETGITNLIYPGDNLVVSATALDAERIISIDVDFIEYPVENTP